MEMVSSVVSLAVEHYVITGLVIIGLVIMVRGLTNLREPVIQSGF